jgi:hypothetical protein
MFWRAMLKLLSRQTGEQTTELFVEAEKVMIITVAAQRYTHR